MAKYLRVALVIVMALAVLPAAVSQAQEPVTIRITN